MSKNPHSTLPTTYRNLTSSEQNNIISQIADYRQKIASIQPIPRHLNAEQQAFVRTGAKLLLHFPNCIQSVQPILSRSIVSDREANRIFYLFRIVSEELASEMSVVAPSGEQVIILPKSQSLRRGRPTAQESEQRRSEQQQKARAEALSSLTGCPIVQPEPSAIDTSRPSDTSRRKSEPDLFSSAIESAIESASTTTDGGDPSLSPSSTPVGDTQSPATSGGSATVPDASPSVSDGGASAPTPSASISAPTPLHSLREWLWILPAHLQAKVKTLRDTRAQISSHSEQAKLLLEQGASQDQISEHTQAAALLNDQIAETYEGIDRHLAVMYIMLSSVNPSYGNYADKYAERGGINALLADLKPYYDKLTLCDDGARNAVAILERANKLEADRAARENRDPEKEKRIHAIKAYFSRKDVKNTQSRLDKLRAYYTEAQQLGVDSDTLASFQLYIDDCAANL